MSLPKSPFDAMLDRHKQENSAVPLPPPYDPRMRRLPGFTTAEKLHAGDLSSVKPLLTMMVRSGTAYCAALERLPDLPAGTAEGAAVVAAKAALEDLKRCYAVLSEAAEGLK